MSDIVRKVQAACAFGTPGGMVTKEIVGEVQLLIDSNERLERMVGRIRQLCEADGVNPTVQAIRRVIDE